MGRHNLSLLLLCLLHLILISPMLALRAKKSLKIISLEIFKS